MQVYKELNKNLNLSIALGFFDGIHLAHKTVIGSAIDFAQKNNLKSAVITFIDHPHCYFFDVEPKYILTRENRIKRFEDLGIDYLYLLNFADFAKLNKEDYLKKLVENLHPKAISTGFNHFFGLNKTGNANYLKEMQKIYEYEYFEIPSQKYNNDIISSSLIRKAILDGDIKLANSLLDYEFFVEGKVIEGQKIGRTLGFKTANIEYPKDLIVLSGGVYAVNVEFKHKQYKAIANFGTRPTFSDSKQKVLEINIKDFEQNIYNEVIKVSFLYRIRDEKKFSSKKELTEQIKKDIKCLE